jgi:2-pyrone-4,6-dicarboxylate lactonase
MTEPILTYMRTPSEAKFKLPVGATDTHVHIFGPNNVFPYAETRGFTPVDAPKEALFAWHKKMGIDRCVIVNTLLHGYDNSVVEDAMRAAKGRYLGIALVQIDVSDAELKRLAQVGFRGVRFHFMPGYKVHESPEQIIALTKRLEPLGMHLQLQLHAQYAKELMPVLRQSAVTVVMDHMGRVDASLGIEHEYFQDFCRLLELPGFMVKVSGIDRIDPTPPYTQGITFARHLVRNYPDRCVWGSDWPHPNHTHVPDDGVLVDSLAAIAPKPDVLHQLLVDNPQRLYRFSA